MTAPQSPADPNRRAIVILLVGLSAVALFLLVTQVLGGGDDDEAVGPVTTTSRPSGTTTTTTTPGETPVESFEVFSTKNPFVPLRVTGGATGVTGTTGSTGTGGTTTGSTSSGTSTGGTSTGSTGTGGTSSGTSTGGTSTGGGSTEPRRSQRVALLDVFAEQGNVVANVRVNDRVYKVSAGETFADSFRALSLSQTDDCGQFMFGDDQFRLCRGEELLK